MSSQALHLFFTFETPASEAELFFRDTDGAGPSEVIFYDTDNNELITVDGTETFQRVTVDNLPSGTRISRIEIINDGNTGDVVVDDFSFTAGGDSPSSNRLPNNFSQEVQSGEDISAGDLYYSSGSDENSLALDVADSFGDNDYFG